MALKDINNITAKELRHEYLELAKKYHPDLHPENASKFQTLQQQYQQCQLIINQPNQYRVTVSISLKESITGCERFYYSQEANKKFLLKIPAGVQNQQTIVYRGLKDQHGKCTILHLKIKLTLPLNYSIFNNCLVLDLKVPFYKMFFGGKFKFTAPDGKLIQIDLPKRAKNGEYYIVASAGLFDRQEKQRLNLYVQIKQSII